MLDGSYEIFLCQGGQGGREERGTTVERAPGQSEGGGVWLSIWVDDVDAVHRKCVERGFELTRSPVDEPWERGNARTASRRTRVPRQSRPRPRPGPRAQDPGPRTRTRTR